MSMSIHIVGMRDPLDPEFQKHEKVLRVCDAAGVKELPKETAEYLGGRYVELSLLDESREVDCDFAKKWSNDNYSGYEVRVEDIPPEVKLIRFYMSW